MTDPQNPADPTPPPAAPQGPPAYSAPPPAAPQGPPAYSAPPPAQQPYAQQPYAQQPYAAAPPAQYGAPVNAPVPGRTLGIVAFILSFFIQLVALILGIVALVQSRKAGAKNGFAVAAIIISAVLLVVGVIIAIIVVATLGAAASFASEALAACQAVDFTGTVTVHGITVDCSTLSH